MFSKGGFLSIVFDALHENEKLRVTGGTLKLRTSGWLQRQLSRVRPKAAPVTHAVSPRASRPQEPPRF